MKNRKQALAAQMWLLADLEQANAQRRSFASRAYREAVWALDSLPPDLTVDRSELLAIPGVGNTIADLILEFVATGTIGRLDRLRATLPASAVTFARLPRMSPARQRALKQFGIETAEDLKKAAANGTLAELPRIGAATSTLWEQRSLELLRPGLPIQRAAVLAARFQSHLHRHVGGDFEVVGGVRRLDEWIDVIELRATGAGGLDEFLTQSALVIDFDSGSQRRLLDTLAGRFSITEGPDRERLPARLRLRGDFHVHTDWSPDGRQTLVAVAARAHELGWKYLAITDHSEGLRFGGLNADDLRRQHQEIVRIRVDFPDLLILHGAELNIDREGGLDLDDEILALLDFRLAGVHSHFGLDHEEQTARLIRTIRHPLVHAIAHLTGRRLGVRPPIDLDLPLVFAAAARHNTALEVNGHLDRLDLSPANTRLAAAAGVLFVANSDAHVPIELRNVWNSERVLAHAGVPGHQVINTWEPARVLNWLRGRGLGPVLGGHHAAVANLDPIDEAISESFPASDPPSWAASRPSASASRALASAPTPKRTTPRSQGRPPTRKSKRDPRA